MESDTDELAELLRIAADEGELRLSENISPNCTSTGSKKETTVSSNNGAEKPIKLAEDAMDSSDEEDLQNFFDRKYSEYGRDINLMLKRKTEERFDAKISNEIDKSLRKDAEPKLLQRPHAMTKPTLAVHESEHAENVYTDPVFGIRIVQPLISSAMLKERIVGRIPVDIRNLQNHLQSGDLSKDWCVSGVIVNKGAIQTSQQGAQYVVWKLTDLKGEIKTTSLFLFKSAYKELWKTALGMVIAVLNPSVFSKKDGNCESSLSIDNVQRVMILGKSKDFGTCKSKKKNGEMCTAIVNLNTCEYCVYHVKQEYGKLSTRSELQSATSGRGLKSLRNKVLGKNEVFYAGKSFVAEPAAKASRKTMAKDQQRLMTLSDGFRSTASPAALNASQSSANAKYLTNNGRSSKIAEAIDTSSAQRLKDLERLKSLNVSMSSLSPSTSNIAKSTALGLQTLSIDLNKAPSLSRESFSFTLTNSTSSQQSTAKAKAIALLKQKPIEKSNPNFIKYRGTENGKKRALETIEREVPDEAARKKQKLADEVEKFRNERIKQLISAKSSHLDLIQSHENAVQDQYFTKLEKKEAMEEKMLNTKRVECKAVICTQCKYKAFSAAPRCKEENHPLKVIDAEKRFYECENCGNRTVTLFRIPKTSCTNCQGSQWKRSGMIREKIAANVGEQLSIRGDEETFIGSLHTKGNLNLCVANN